MCKGAKMCEKGVGLQGERGVTEAAPESRSRRLRNRGGEMVERALGRGRRIIQQKAARSTLDLLQQ